MTEGTGRTPDEDIRRRLVLPVGATISVVWAAAAFFGFFTEDFIGLEICSPIMVVFVGWVFGVSIVRTGEKSATSASASRGSGRR